MAIKVGTLQVDLIANTASFTGPLDKAGQQAKKSAKDIQDGFNGMDLSEGRGTLMVTGELIGVHIPRHVQALIATLPGLAPVLAAAFPLVAILAVGNAIAEFVKKSDEAKQKLEEHKSAATEAAAAFARHSNELEINNLKLKDRLAILNQRPAQNGVAIAADEAKKKIDELEDSLKKALLTQQNLFKTQIDSAFMSFIGKGSGQVSEMASHFHQGLEQIKEYYDDWHRYENIGDTANAEKFKALYEQKKQGIRDFASDSIQSLKDIQSAPAPVLKKSELSPDPDRAKAQQSAATEAYEKQRAAAAELLPAVQTLYGTFLQGEKQLTEETKAAESEKGIARVEAMQQRIALLDKQYASEKQVTAEQTKQAIAAYQVEFDQGKITADKLAELKQDALDKEFQAEVAHLEKVKALEAGRPALVKRTDEQIAALNAGHEAQILTTFDATLKKQEELNKSFYLSVLTDYDKDEAAFQKGLSAKNKAYIESINVQHAAAKQHADALEAIDAQGLQFKREMGLISEADYEAEMQTELNATYMTVQKELQAKRDATLAGTKERVAADAQLQALEDKYQKDTERNEQQSLLRRTAAFRSMMKDWQNLSQQMGQTFMQTLNGMNSSVSSFIVTGQGNFRQLATSAIEEIVKIGLQWVESKLLMLATGKVAGAQEVMTQAAIAGAGGTASMAAAPFPLDLGAPAFGAAMMGNALSYLGMLSAERGALLPDQEMLVHTHPKEMILPQNISNFIVGAASSASGSGSGADTHHFVFAPTIHAVDADGVDRMLTKHADTFHRHIKSHMRRLNYA